MAKYLKIFYWLSMIIGHSYSPPVFLFVHLLFNVFIFEASHEECDVLNSTTSRNWTKRKGQTFPCETWSVNYELYWEIV